VLRPADANEEQGETDVVEVSAEAEVELDSKVESANAMDALVGHIESLGNGVLDENGVGGNELSDGLVVFKDEEETDGEGGRTPRRDWVTYMDDV
jgi:hypothetical protein